MSKTRILLPLGALLILSTLFRAPMLANLDRMISDFAFVRLQSLEILSGAFSLFLWKSDYQASFEPLFAAFLYKIFGTSLWVFSLVPYLGYGVILFVLVSLLAPLVGGMGAFWLCLPLVFGSHHFVVINLYPHRQWSITVMFLTVLLASFIKPKNRFALALAFFLPFFALYLDFYVIVFLVPVLWYLWVTGGKHDLRASFSGLLTGGAVLMVTRYLGPERGAPLSFSPLRILENWNLLFKYCLPITFGFPHEPLPPLMFHTNSWYVPVLIAGNLLVLLEIWGFLWAVFSPQLKAPVRRLGILGGLIVGACLAGFLGSSMASDLASTRYLTPLLWAAPLACLPLAYSWGLRRWATVSTPLFLFIATATWLQYSPLVDGIKIRRDPGNLVQKEMNVVAYLKAKGISESYADYWISYRMMMNSERPLLIVPRDPKADRFLPYRERVEQSQIKADIYSPADPPELLERAAESLKSEGRLLSREAVHDHTILIFRNSEPLQMSAR
jgi:hypothetical protein